MADQSSPLPPLREVIAKHELRARKSLGQNFLLDLNLTGRIARAAAPLAGANIFEVGPGPGGLTRALLDNGAHHVMAIDADGRVMPVLEEIATAYPGRLTAIEGDALAFTPDFADDRPLRIVSNLPYNIATPLLIGWLTSDPWPPRFERMVLMFQKEVADRIVAEPGSKAYGRLSVISQWRTIPRRLFDVDPRAFTPPPKIVSTVVGFDIRPDFKPASTKTLEMVTAKAFGQRRKMLRASLKGFVSDPTGFLESIDIKPTARAEEVGIDGFVRMANAYDALKSSI